jgi:hypothetical protein
MRMHVRTIFNVLSESQGLFDLRWIREGTVLYQGQSLIVSPMSNSPHISDGDKLSNIRRMRALKS